MRPSIVDPLELDRQRALEDRYWWFVGRRSIVSGVLGRFAPRRGGRVLDLAAATGGNAAILARFGEVVSVDLSLHALAHCRKRGCSRLLAADAQALGLASGGASLVACLDLLEHLGDDLAGATEMFRVLEPGGLAIVTVPAYRWLWSSHDEALSHRRRYSLPEVASVLRRAGFEVPFASYCITTMLPVIVAFRLLERVLRPFRSRRPAEAAYVEVPAWLSRVFVALLEAEARVLPRFRLPFGVSCLLVARKPEAGGGRGRGPDRRRP